MPHILDSSQRRAMTSQAIVERRTLMERWETDEVNTFPGWEKRARKVRFLVKAGESVADIGCGSMSLEKHLPAGTRYVPVDVVSRDERTVVVDLNKQSLPDLNVDTIVALGLIEYLFDPKAFIKRCYETSQKLIFSYHPIDLNYGHDRLADYWVNNLTVSNIISTCLECGYPSVTVLASLRQELLFMVKRRAKIVRA